MAKSYRSAFEKKVHAVLGPKWKYEPTQVPYVSSHEYTPDFIHKDEVGSKHQVLIEVKGYFRTSGEARKYIDIRDSNPDAMIIFIFTDPEKGMPGAKKRKDGTKYTMAEWADKHKFFYYTIDQLDKFRDEMGYNE